jgi:acyl-coenzyme A synthetase/AMP-(fatty) acid ligase
MDDTIKVKGYRVNLGEIEHCLGSCDWVSSCIVVDIQSDAYQTDLVALYMPRQEESVNEEEAARFLKDLCTKELPPYMVPKKFIARKRWPLTSSGKIDRKVLKKELASSVL